MTKIVALTVGSFLNVVRLSSHDVTFTFTNAILLAKMMSLTSLTDVTSTCINAFDCK